MRFLGVLFLLALIGAARVWAAEAPNIADLITPDVSRLAMAEEGVPEDLFDRGTPRSAMEGYLRAARQGDFERASQYLDLRNLPQQIASIAPAKLAEDFYQVLDRTLWVDTESMSILPEGKSKDGLPAYRESIGRIETSAGRLTLLLQKVPREDGVFIWKVSNATVKKIPELAQEFAYGPIGQWFSTILPKISFLGVALWIWLLLASLVLTTWLIVWFPLWLLARLVLRADTEKVGVWRAFILKPLSLLLTLIILGQLVAIDSLGVSVAALLRAQTLWLFCWAWLLIHVIELAVVHYTAGLDDSNKTMKGALLRPLAATLKFIVVISIALMWLENLGFSPTTALAGLGIGGLAFALAAQKSIENMIGAVTLYVSSPVKVGQLCRFGSQIGTIEEIGLRATRVRTLDRSVVHIPNATFADMQLENISQRERISYRPTIHIDARYLPDNVTLETVLERARQSLAEQDCVAKEPLRVRLKAFEHHALVIDVLAYIETTDFDQYLMVAERLNLCMLNVFLSAGFRLATPMGVAE
ncbi:hypothetical protein R50072_02530 [Simiduia litorea]|uniref:mechanosensitive ion channel family protein n=1 Tax=Simiduia litorea TaxID=1435348 RepID=UPI0036F44397